MTPEEIIKETRNEFEQRLGRKTGWGKNEVIHLYDQVVADVLLHVAVMGGQK